MAEHLLKKILQKSTDTTIDLSKIADIINEGYVKNVELDLKEKGIQRKKSFAPSKLVWNEGTCPRYWYLAFEGNEVENKSDGPGIENMLTGNECHEIIAKELKKQNIFNCIE